MREILSNKKIHNLHSFNQSTSNNPPGGGGGAFFPFVLKFNKKSLFKEFYIVFKPTLKKKKKKKTPLIGLKKI